MSLVNALSKLIAHRESARELGATTEYLNELTWRIAVLRTRVGRVAG